MEKEYKRNLSIVIPHYNTPDLLKKLIDSIPHIKDIQIIVVDDNSNVHLEELDALQANYRNQVEFYRNDTGIKGAGTCRNIGLRHADGKWLLFADADDYFLDGMYETVKLYFNSEYDEVFFIPTSIYADTGEIAAGHLKYEKQIKDYILNPTIENLLKVKTSFTVPWSKLIRHELVQKHNIWFDEVLYFNDLMFSIKTGYYSKKISLSEKEIYCIVRRKGSLSMQVSWSAYEIRMQEYLKVCDFLKEHYSLRDMKKMHYTCLGMLYRAIKNHYGIKKYIWIIKTFHKHGIPLFSITQINMESFRQIKRSIKMKRIDSKYVIKEK